MRPASPSDLIVVAGLKRSGTTWMFNVIRLALPRYKTWRNYKHVPPGRVILKTHWWQQELQDRASLVFSSTRNLDEANASLLRFSGGEITDRLLSNFECWDAVADYRMVYANLLSDPVAVAADIIDVLGVKANPERIAREVAQIKLPDRGVDPTTFYHVNHFTKAKVSE